MSLFLFILASICNAVMDVVSFHYSKSVFATPQFKQRWWDASVSWKNKYINGDPTLPRTKTPTFLTDAWHFFKSLMILLIVCGFCAGIYEAQHLNRILKVWHYLLVVIVYGSVWNIFFGIFYNNVLVKK